MQSSVGHTIQKLFNNSPEYASVSAGVSLVTTSGGGVYQAGFIDGKMQTTFTDVIDGSDVVGRIVQTASLVDKAYLLNSAGSVYEYDYNSKKCTFAVREVYSPVACNGDKAVRLEAGSRHALILTENCKVWGVGDNSEYQLVPQGQCRYDTAVEILITDTNIHDNNCPNKFTGIISELNEPVINKADPCNNVTCLKKDLCDVLLGYANYSCASVNDPCESGTLGVPLYGDISYVAFLCVDEDGCTSGYVNYTISRIYIKCGCFVSTYTTRDECGCHIKEFNTSSTNEITIFTSSRVHPKKSLCGPEQVPPISGTANIQGKCGSCCTIDLLLPSDMCIPGALYDGNCNIILLELNKHRTSLTALCDAEFVGLSTSYDATLDLELDISLDSCKPHIPVRKEMQLPQPNWRKIAAGHNISILVDSCNRLYALGSLHQVRSNKNLLKGDCLEDLLNKTTASVTFPADQLNCNKRAPRNDCDDHEDDHHTDLTKFGVHLNFPGGNAENQQMNVCEFLNRLKNCNGAKECAPVCEPCDGYIYIDVTQDNGSCVPGDAIGSITLFNKKSITKTVSHGCFDTRRVGVDLNSVVEFGINQYCIDNADIPLDQVILLDFCNEGPNVNLYLDTDNTGGIRFAHHIEDCNVEFSVSAGTKTRQFILNFGSIMDPVELTNLKFALSLDCHYPSAKYLNPFNTKITNTYLRGGDRVRFVNGNYKNVRQAVTADLPTIFRLNRRINDVAVGNNNLSVLVGGLACPNEVFAIGTNCLGELGIGSYQSVVNFNKVDSCYFDCQVSGVHAGHGCTFYVTQSHKIYASGQWKCWINSSHPEPLRAVCDTWKIKNVAISSTHIILTNNEGGIFGLGDNTMGELGLGHTNCIDKPNPLLFFYEMNNSVARQLRHNLDHPYESKFDTGLRIPSIDSLRSNIGHGNNHGNNNSNRGHPRAPCQNQNSGNTHTPNVRIPPMPQMPQMPNHNGDGECKNQGNRFQRQPRVPRRYNPNSKISVNHH
jgi:alpha-tubulin suppressor-like RCC1 family protein